MSVGGYIVYRLKFQSFSDAVEFLRRVAEAADKLAHHPDVELRYVYLTLRLTTHDAGNKITHRDKDMAKEIDRIIEEMREFIIF